MEANENRDTIKLMIADWRKGFYCPTNAMHHIFITRIDYRCVCYKKKIGSRDTKVFRVRFLYYLFFN